MKTMLQTIAAIFILVSIQSQALFGQCNKPFKPGNSCETAPVICSVGDLDGYCTTLQDVVNPSGPNPLCLSNGGGVPNNTAWIGFVAGSSNMAIELIPGNCLDVGGNTGFQTGIITGCPPNSKEIVCTGTCVNAPYLLSSQNFVPGKLYYLWIDGCGGSFCDVTIDMIQGSIQSADPPGSIGNINGENHLTCTSGFVTYSVPPVKGATSYYWTLDGLPVGDIKKDTNTISLQIKDAGTHLLCVDVANYCQDVTSLPAQKCFQIEVEGILLTDTTLVPLLCYGDKNGAVGFEVSGGTPPYSFQWSTGDTTSSISNLKAGNYLLTVKDDSVCSKNVVFNLSQPDSLELILYIFNTSGPDLLDGKSILNVVGGTPPYKILWSTGDSVNVLDKLSPGGYCVTVTDFNDCVKYECGVVEKGSGTGTNEPLCSDWKLFPVPAKDYLYLQHLQPDNRAVQLRIVSAEGKEMVRRHEKNTTSTIPLFIGNLPSGVYYLAVFHDSKQLYARFVKQ